MGTADCIIGNPQAISFRTSRSSHTPTTNHEKLKRYLESKRMHCLSRVLYALLGVFYDVLGLKRLPFKSGD